MKVLLTGATGFIGGNIARELSRKGYAVKALVRPGANLTYLADLDVEYVTGDIRDRDSVDQAITGCAGVFHAAALYAFWARDTATFSSTNVEGTRTVLASALANGIRRVVFTSSESTIAVPNGRLGTEDGEASLADLPGEYKKTKLLAEREALGFCARGLHVVVVNPTMPIGPGDLKPTPTGRTIVDFLSGRLPACFRTGMNVIDVADVAAGHVRAFEVGRSGERYILGNRNMSFREILQTLSRITSIPCPRFDLPPWVALSAGALSTLVEGTLFGREPHVPLNAVRTARKVRHFDCSKAVRELSLPQTPVEGAFERAVNWFLENGYVNGGGRPRGERV